MVRPQSMTRQISVVKDCRSKLLLKKLASLMKQSVLIDRFLIAQNNLAINSSTGKLLTICTWNSGYFRGPGPASRIIVTIPESQQSLRLFFTD